jgi:hypothetical protein
MIEEMTDKIPTDILIGICFAIDLVILVAVQIYGNRPPKYDPGKHKGEGM